MDTENVTFDTLQILIRQHGPKPRKIERQLIRARRIGQALDALRAPCDSSGGES